MTQHIAVGRFTRFRRLGPVNAASALAAAACFRRTTSSRTAAAAVAAVAASSAERAASSLGKWHFLYFCPEPQWQGSLRPIFMRPRV